MKVLEVKNIDKFFGKKQILKDISFDIEEGEILGFVGPNGSGKTTTIKIILGLQQASCGEVFINGNNIKDNYENAIRKVGAIVESPDMYMYLSGLENLKLVANYYNISHNEIERVVEFVGLKDRIKDKVSKYSLGMRQRLGIAQAILNKPNLLIVDEPTNGLDPSGIIEFRNMLKELAKKEKMSIFISSHNLAEIENICDKVLLLKEGKIVSSDVLKEVENNDKYKLELSSTLKLKKEAKVEIIDDNYIYYLGNKEDIAKFIETLVNKKIKIYSVVKCKESLEDIFIKKTGGK
jgi:bacitracin ABC transporter ATP-binding protein